MPRENQKRGRREEKKRKTDGETDQAPTKRQRIEEDHTQDRPDLEVYGDAGDDFISFGERQVDEDVPQNQFFGLLEPSEQEYYANVNVKISANDFESDEDRDLFIQAVHNETKGKEMKVASSQSCSRYLEKVINLSNAEQLKSLFTAFLEHLTYLVQHRFGSHCCETLFLRAAKLVKPDKNSDADEESLEACLIRSAAELESNIGYLLTERFASHSLRVLLLVLSGEPLQEESTKSIIASRRKEKLDVTQPEEQSLERRKVPDSFKAALYQLIHAAVSSIDTTYLRALATHPVGNPVLQLLLRLELTIGLKSRQQNDQKLLVKLLPDEDFEEDSETAKFVLGLVYDPTGSHLTEILVRYLPGKIFKKLYKNLLKGRMRTLSKNDVASFVAIRILERLGKDDLQEAIHDILPEVQGLVARSRTGLLKVLFERCAVRQVSTKPLLEVLQGAYGTDVAGMLPKMLQSNTTDGRADTSNGATNDTQMQQAPSKADLHGSLLAQAMLQDADASALMQASILAQPIASLISMSKVAIPSRVMQVALTSGQSQPQFRRQLVPKFYGYIADLAQDPSGSHVVDALWDGTRDLHFMKERLAREMADSELTLRESSYGRNVWKNWSMDTHSRRFAEWRILAKAPGDPGRNDSLPNPTVVKKTGIQVARERHAEKIRKEGRRGIA